MRRKWWHFPSYWKSRRGTHWFYICRGGQIETGFASKDDAKRAHERNCP